jgi:hypothetical protein
MCMFSDMTVHLRMNRSRALQDGGSCVVEDHLCDQSEAALHWGGGEIKAWD